MVRIETSLHPRIHNMLEAVSQWTEGSSGPRNEDEFWKGQRQASLWPWSSSSPVVGPHIGVCIMTTIPPMLLPWLLCWTVQWVFFPKERSGCVPWHSRYGLGSCNLPALQGLAWAVPSGICTLRQQTLQGTLITGQRNEPSPRKYWSLPSASLSRCVFWTGRKMNHVFCSLYGLLEKTLLSWLENVFFCFLRIRQWGGKTV